MINLPIENRALLVRDLDDWRNMVEYLKLNRLQDSKYALLERAGKAVIYVSTKPYNEQHTRH